MTPRASDEAPVSVDEAEAGLLRGIAFAVVLEAGLGALCGVVGALWLVGVGR